jgi:hypothetical protein
MVPAANSPAIDHGSAFGLTRDERGQPRPTDLASSPNSSAAGADGSDIGAVEVRPEAAALTPMTHRSTSLQPPDFDTAIFVAPNTLYLRLKCPARFKPTCVSATPAA